MTRPTDEASILLDGPWSHRTVRANGIALHVAEIGTGPLVLFLHGFPQFWWTWRRQLVDVAAAGYRAVAVDLRGFGASDKPPRGYDLVTLADDIAGLVASLGERNAVLVGHDLGGLVAWSVAARDPDVLRGIVPIAAPHPLRLRSAVVRDPRGQGRALRPALTTFQLPRWPERLLTRDSSYVRGLFDAWSGPAWQNSDGYDTEVERYAESMRVTKAAYCAMEYFRWAFRSVPRPDGHRAFTRLHLGVDVPVLQLHGELDRWMLPRTAQGSGQYVNAEYEWRLLRGAGHFLPDEVPDLVSSELINWMKRVT